MQRSLCGRLSTRARGHACSQEGTRLTNVTDVVVVGSGAAGMTAALAAAVAGAKVTVIERAPVFGGTTAVSGGGMWLPRNAAGAALGIEDTEEAVRTYLNRVSFGRTAEDVLEAFIKGAPATHDFIVGNSPVKLDGTHVADYLTNLPGAKNEGRQVAPGLYDTNRLGDWKDKVRLGPWPTTIVFITQKEKETLDDIAKVGRERIEAGIAGRGRGLVAGLLEAGLERGAEYLNNTRLVGLSTTAGRVTGVEVLDGGRHSQIQARRGVILASGGFEWNRSMWRSLIGVPFDGPMSPPFNEGDGLAAAARVGAKLGSLNDVWWMPSIQVPGEMYDGRPRYRSARNRGLPHGIVVNRHGQRFGNESMNYNDFGKLQVAFDPHPYEFVNARAFHIFDQTHYEKYPMLESADDPIPDWPASAPTISALAEKLGIDTDGLERQVDEFNRNAEQGVDPVFHRGEARWERKLYSWERFKVDDPFGPDNPAVAPVISPPFYGAELKIGCFGTKGGVVINADGQAIDWNDQPIPGLYACGNVAASVFGPAYPGGGSTLGPATVFGYLAGTTAAS
jgi:3-oxosteroid 1-dehydrogenase